MSVVIILGKSWYPNSTQQDGIIVREVLTELRKREKKEEKKTEMNVKTNR